METRVKVLTDTVHREIISPITIPFLLMADGSTLKQEDGREWTNSWLRGRRLIIKRELDD